MFLGPSVHEPHWGTPRGYQVPAGVNPRAPAKAGTALCPLPQPQQGKLGTSSLEAWIGAWDHATGEHIHPHNHLWGMQLTICSSSEYWWQVPVQHSTRLWRTGQSLIISGWLSCCWRGEECNMIAVFMVRSRYLLLLLLIGEYFKTLKNQHPDFRLL